MKIFTTFCCAALVLCSAIFAQSPADHLTVRLNSAVMVGDTRLPAGNCDIQVLHGASDSIILVLRSEGGPYVAASASHISESDADDSSAKLVFSRRGSDLQLDRVMMGNHIGYQLNHVE